MDVRCCYFLIFALVLVTEPYLCHSLDRGVNPDALRLYTNSRGRVFAVEYMVKDARVLVKPFSIPSERLREITVVGSSAYAVHMHDGSLWRYQLVRNQPSSSLLLVGTKIVSKSVRSFAVDAIHGHVFYTVKEEINASPGDHRLYMTNKNGTHHRTLVGFGKAVAADYMAVDPVSGYLFFLSITGPTSYRVSRSNHRGDDIRHMNMTKKSPESKLSHLMATRTHNKTAVFWLETYAGQTFVYRSRHGLNPLKVTSYLSSHPVKDLWSTPVGIHIIQHRAEGPFSYISSFANKHLSNYTKPELRATGALHSKTPCTSDPCPLHSFCLRREAGHTCLPSTAGKLSDNEDVVIATAGGVVARIFVNQHDANNVGIVEPIYVNANMLASSMSVEYTDSGYKLYITDNKRMDAGRILHVSPNDNSTTLFEDKGISSSQAIAYDPGSRALLWNNGGHMIEVVGANKHGSVHRTVRHTVVQESGKIEGLVADSNTGLMFWIQDGHSIVKSYLDGKSPDILVYGRTGVTTPLVLDTSASVHTLYWCQKEQKNWIYRMALNSREPVAVAVSDHAIPEGLTVSHDMVYIAMKSSVHAVQKRNNIIYSITDDNKVADIVGVSSLAYIKPKPSLTPSSSPCALHNGGCSELCLPSGNRTSACYCSAGATVVQVLMTGRKTCNRPTPKVLTAGRGRLLRLVTSHAGDFAETDIKLPPCPHARRDDCYLVTADSVKQHIYVAIRHGQEIFRQTYGKAGKMDKVLVTGANATSAIGGLAFDAASSNLLWTDSKSHRVEAVHVDRRRHDLRFRTVLLKNVRRPKHIELNPIAGRMYIVTTEAQGTAIVEADMHGEHQRIIYERPRGASTPVSLSYNQQNNALFIAVADGSIAHVHLDRENYTTIVQSPPTDVGMAPVHLATSRTKLYFTTRGAGNKALFSATIQPITHTSLSHASVGLAKAVFQSLMPISSPVVLVESDVEGSFSACAHSWLCGGLCLPRGPEYTSGYPPCYSPLGQLDLSNTHKCRGTSCGDSLLVATTDGVLRLVNTDVGTGRGKRSANTAAVNLTSLPTLPHRLPKDVVISIAYSPKRNGIYYLNAQRRAVEFITLDGHDFSTVHNLGVSSGHRSRLSPKQLWLNQNNNYLYVVGGPGKMGVVFSDHRYAGPIVYEDSDPLMATTDDDTGTLFWLVSDTAVDLIMWGTSYVNDKYQRFFKPHGTRYGKITALAAGHHRLIFADSLTQSLLLCPYKGGYRVDKANREQEKCTGEHVHVVQSSVGIVSSMQISGDTLYYINSSGLFSLELPDVSALLTRSSGPVKLTSTSSQVVAYGRNILAAVIHRQGSKASASKPKPNPCILNDTCQFFCHPNGDDITCGCQRQWLLAPDQKTCSDSFCTYYEFPCRASGSFPQTCIMDGNKCDGHCDCLGACDDENKKMCDDVLCSEGTFRCPHEQYCYTEAQRCDGEMDCLHASLGDEANCSVPVTCGRNDHFCELLTGGQACLPESKLCDGINDCRNNTDEENVYCNSTDAPPGSLGPIEADRHTDSTNIITGLTMGTLFMALVIIFIVFYVHQKKNSERYKQQVHTSMMGAVVTGSSMKESTSPCSSVSLSDGCESASRSDSNTSPSRDTMAQSSKGTEVTGLKSMSQSSSTSGRVDTSGQELTCITRKGSSGNSEDDSAITVGGDSPDAVSKEDSDTDCSDDENRSYTDSINPSESAGEGQETEVADFIGAVPSGMMDLLSITTAELNQNPCKTMEKETLGSESGRHGDEVLSFKQAGIPQYRSPAQARRPLNSQGRPRPNPYGYPTLPEYPSLHPQHHHRFDSVSMEFNSVAGDPSTAGGPCPSECSVPMAAVAPCPSLCSHAPSVSMSYCTGDSVSLYKHQPVGHKHCPETVPSEDCSMITDGCSVVTDGCSMVTGASSIGPPAPPCGSPVTVAAMDEEESVEEGTWQ